MRRKFEHMPLFFLKFVAKPHKRQKPRVLASEILDIYSVRSNFEVLRCQLTAKKSAISLIFGGWTWIWRFRFWFRILQTATWCFVSCHELQKRLHFGLRDFGHLPLLFKHRRFRLHLGHCEEHNFTNIWRKNVFVFAFCISRFRLIPWKLVHDHINVPWTVSFGCRDFGHLHPSFKNP